MNQFVMQELLPQYPSAIIEEDDDGRIPFTEAIICWIEARRAVRKWKLETDLTREKVALVAARLQKRTSQSIYATHAGASDSDSEDGSSVSSSTRVKFASTRKMSRMASTRPSIFMSRDNYAKMARNELKMIVDSSVDAMFCIDERGNILLTNDAAVKKFGYSKKELTASNISILMNQREREAHDGYLENYMKTGVKKVMGKRRELTARKKDGSTFQFELGLTEVNLGGGKAIFVGFCRDLSDLKQHRASLEFVDSELNNTGEENTANDDEVQRARGLPPLVEWCLTMLGEIVDSGGSIQDLASRRGSNNIVDDDSSEGLNASFTNSFTSGGLNDSVTAFNPIRSSILGGRLERQSSFLKMMDTIIVEKVASIPYLLEELLLIEDPEARLRVFDMSIVKKVLFSVDSIGKGDWLILMLDKSISVQKQKVLDSNLSGDDYDDTAEGRAFQLKLQIQEEECRLLAESVIFYLERVSCLNIQDDLTVFHHVQMTRQVTRSSSGFADMISTGDLHHFRVHRDELFDAVGALKGLVRRICVLDDDLVKRAAATSVIRRLLDRVMFSPFATIQALMDGINHILLMLSFRMGPAAALFHLAADDLGFRPHRYLFSTAILCMSVSYFGTKTVHAMIAKYALSQNLFWNDALSFWNLVDTLPLVMVLLCSVAVDSALRMKMNSDMEGNVIPFYLRSAVAITTPFLWLRILAFVKVRNKQLATFILCSIEIIRDIKWFLLVLFAAMASFAQMWVTLTFESGQTEDSQYYIAGYIKAYTMMLGDLDSDALQTHPLITMIFVLYTFGVTIVLLNILIAIVSDSYQNTYVSSKMMLGKARIMFVSEMLSLKTFHQMWMEGKSSVGIMSRRNINYFFGVISMLLVGMVTQTINLKLGQDEFCEIGAASSNRIYLEAIILFVSSAVTLAGMKMIVAYVLNEFNETGGLRDGNKVMSQTHKAINWFIATTFSNLSSTFDSLFDRSDHNILEGANTRESTGTQEQRSEQKIQRSIEKSRKQLKSELKGMFEQIQFSLREQDDQNKKELASLEERISLAVASAMAESHRSLLNALQSSDPRIVANDDDDDDVSSSSISIELDDGGA
jgi:PAS domain S-box-containing protein